MAGAIKEKWVFNAKMHKALLQDVRNAGAHLGEGKAGCNSKWAKAESTFFGRPAHFYLKKDHYNPTAQLEG